MRDRCAIDAEIDEETALAKPFTSESILVGYGYIRVGQLNTVKGMAQLPILTHDYQNQDIVQIISIEKV